MSCPGDEGGVSRRDLLCAVAGEVATPILLGEMRLAQPARRGAG